MLQVHHELTREPLISIARLVQKTGLTKPTVAAALNRLILLGVVKEIKQSPRKRLFIYDRYIEILEQGTEPIGGPP